MITQQFLLFGWGGGIASGGFRVGRARGKIKRGLLMLSSYSANPDKRF